MICAWMRLSSGSSRTIFRGRLLVFVGADHPGFPGHRARTFVGIYFCAIRVGRGFLRETFSAEKFWRPGSHGKNMGEDCPADNGIDGGMGEQSR